MFDSDIGIINLLKPKLVCIIRYHIIFIHFFFFQAEDGIRDLYVTGVQTCALPICRSIVQEGAAARFHLHHVGLTEGRRGTPPSRRSPRVSGRGRRREDGVCPGGPSARSEERRVGKECRCWGSAYR